MVKRGTVKTITYIGLNNEQNNWQQVHRNRSLNHETWVPASLFFPVPPSTQISLFLRSAEVPNAPKRPPFPTSPTLRHLVGTGTAVASGGGGDGIREWVGDSED